MMRRLLANAWRSIWTTPQNRLMFIMSFFILRALADILGWLPLFILNLNSNLIVRVWSVTSYKSSTDCSNSTNVFRADSTSQVLAGAKFQIFTQVPSSLANIVCKNQAPIPTTIKMNKQRWISSIQHWMMNSLINTNHRQSWSKVALRWRCSQHWQQSKRSSSKSKLTPSSFINIPPSPKREQRHSEWVWQGRETSMCMATSRDREIFTRATFWLN